MVAQVDDRTDAEAPSAAGLQGNIERMWAYLTIKEILEKRLESDDKDEKERLKQRALQMSLRVSVAVYIQGAPGMWFRVSVTVYIQGALQMSLGVSVTVYIQRALECYF